MPALFTSTSILPKRLSTAATIASNASGRARSAGMVCIAPGLSCTVAASAASPASLRSTAATSTPAPSSPERHRAPDAARRARHDRDLLLAGHGRVLPVAAATVARDHPPRNAGRGTSLPSIDARPRPISAMPRSAPGVIASPSSKAPNSSEVIGSRNVTSSRLVAPAIASRRKYTG